MNQKGKKTCGIDRKEAREESRRVGKEGRKDGGRDLDLYSAIVAASSSSLTPLDIQLLSLLVPNPFSSTKAVGPSPGIAKEQPRGRIYCSYCNVDESPAEFRELAVYFRPSSFYMRYTCVGVHCTCIEAKGIVLSSLAR